MADDLSAPATKGDLKKLEERLDMFQGEMNGFRGELKGFQGETKENMAAMLEYIVRNDEKIHELRQDMKIWKDEMLEQMGRWKDDMFHQFQVIAENIHHDMLHGALHDRVEQHEDRIRRLETRFIRQ